jgi:hypothetical protein
MEDFSWGIILGLVFGTGFTVMFLNNEWRNDLINRGYVIYCPLDGQFAFVGECE